MFGRVGPRGAIKNHVILKHASTRQDPKLSCCQLMLDLHSICTSVMVIILVDFYVEFYCNENFRVGKECSTCFLQ